MMINDMALNIPHIHNHKAIIPFTLAFSSAMIRSVFPRSFHRITNDLNHFKKAPVLWILREKKFMYQELSYVGVRIYQGIRIKSGAHPYTPQNAPCTPTTRSIHVTKIPINVPHLGSSEPRISLRSILGAFSFRVFEVALKCNKMSFCLSVATLKS